MKRILIIVLFTVLLTSCIGGELEGESIEECMSDGLCHYNNNDVTTEGSPMSEALEELIRMENDTLTFNYNINPGGDTLGFIYETSESFSVDLTDQLIDLLIQAKAISDKYYQIDSFLYDIRFTEGHLGRFYLDEDNELEYLDFTFDTRLNKYVEQDDEQDVLEYLEDTIDMVKLCLTHPEFSRIHWYGALQNISIEPNLQTVIITIDDDIYTDAIEQFITDNLTEFSIEIVIQ